MKLFDMLWEFEGCLGQHQVSQKGATISSR